MAKIELSARDIDHIARVVETEVSRGIQRADPQVYNDMVSAVVDTVTNRLATGRYGKTVQDVLNDRRAFSKITGPKSLNPYGSVQKAPAAPTSTRAVVAQHLADRAKGKPSIVGGALDYANPAHSSPNNISGWIDPMRAAGAVRLGIGKQEHYHGLAPHNIGRAAPDYEISVPEDVASMATGQYSQPSYPDNLRPTGGLVASRAPTREDARLGDAWGFQDPTTTAGVRMADNAPLPGGLFDDPRNMRDISVGLLGGVAPPASRPGMPAPGMATPTARASNPNRPGLPAPMSRPSPSMAAPSVMSAAVQERMTGVPMSDRQITASVPDMPAASAMLSRTAPSINARPAMERPTAMASLSPSVQERMGGFPDVPTPTQRAELSPSVMERMDGFPSSPAPTRSTATQDLSPSVMDRMGGLLSMDAKAATMPGSLPNGLLSDVPPASQPFGRPDAIAYADPVPARPTPSVPSYKAPPASYQTPAFSTAPPQIDALGQPPIPGLQRAPQAPAQRQVAATVPDVPAYTAPRDVAPAPTIAGPVGRQRQAETPTRSNINTDTADRNMAQVAASRALDTVAERSKGGLFSGGFSGPSGVMGGAMLGGAMGGLPGAAIGGLLGSQTVRDAIGLGGGSSGFGTGQLSAGALSALNAGWGGFGNMNATQQLATSLAREQAEQQAREAAQAGYFDGWGFAGNQASSSALPGRTTSYRGGSTSMGGEGGFGSGTMSDSARSSAKSGGGLF